MSNSRSWWRKHFHDHPGAAAKLPNAYVESDTGHTKTSKLYCKACLVVDIERIIAEDLSGVDQGRLTAVRTEHEIEAYRESISQFIYTM